VLGKVEKNSCRIEKFWFVCQTNPREENRAKYFLEEKGFEVFMPMMETCRNMGLKTVLFQGPLFPNYLFIRMKGFEDAASVRWTRGVRKMLPDSLRPLAVEDGVIESIRMLADKKGLVRKKPLKARDQVRIVTGPFSGLMGIFDHWASGQGRVAVLLQFVNYPARVDLHYTQVEKVA
jgi:transcriptional antiterminator RfaH